MMDNYAEAEDEQFFDSREEVSSVSELSSECSEGVSTSELSNGALGYELWAKDIESVDERRLRFMKWMGLNSDWPTIHGDEHGDMCSKEMKIGIERLRDNDSVVLANSDVEDPCISGRSSQLGRSSEASELVEDGMVEENLCWKIRNLDDGTEYVVDKLGEDGMPSRLREVSSNRTVTVEEFHRSMGSSPLVQRLLRRDSRGSDVINTKKKTKRSWLQKLGVITHDTDGSKRDNWKPKGTHLKAAVTQRVRVHASKKQLKELSSLRTGQEFCAHNGSISTMKFSPDGQYLASAGKDGIVRVWKVIEDEIPDNFNIQDTEPPCLYFSLDHFSNLAPLNIDKEKMSQTRRSSESACVILPPRVFQILEKPIHEFFGHMGEVLALSWSKNGYLLSSSVDKTARLWRVGQDDSLAVYIHNDYVTCLEFNPVDDNYFISGSIDGKVRLWEVGGCRVIDWTDVREIVTAVCYCPDGKGGVVGSMEGNCRFYDVVDNRLQMVSQICLQEKKKLSHKRITGFQFCPNDESKVMVTCADSQIRILSGSNIICKFKGIRNSGSQASASFTSDGKHVISATEDSNIYVWNYTTQERASSKSKSILSCESFFSHNASIAIPWCGLKTKPGALPGSILANGHCDEKLPQKGHISSPDCFSLSRGFLDSLYKGSATWPEEQLSDSSPVAVSPSICKSEYKFLKNAWQSALHSSHLWGLVIVTAGWDGCIRTFLNYGLPIRF